MNAPKSDAQLEKEMTRAERKRERAKSRNILVILYWLMLALAGTTIAISLGLARNDWVFWTTDVSAGVQATALFVSNVAAVIAAGVIGLFGLFVLLFKRQFIIGTVSLLLGSSFLYLLIGPTALSLAAGPAALVLGVVTLMVIDRKEKRGAKKAA